MIEYYVKAKNEVAGDSIFVDENFLHEPLETSLEETIISLLLLDLSGAKLIFQTMTNDERIQCLRYIFSYRIFCSHMISDQEKEAYKERIEENFGSICNLESHHDACIQIETAIVTRVLYICEVLSMSDFYYIDERLRPLDKGYVIVMQTIKSRLTFHYNF